MKGIKKRISVTVVMLLTLAMFSSVPVMAADNTQTSFSFQISSGGGVYRSNDATKLNYNNYAKVYFSSYSNKSSYPLIARLRSGTNDNYASDTFDVVSTGYYYPTYWSGYGQYDYPYYFKVQTDSLSGYSATGKGTFYA